MEDTKFEEPSEVQAMRAEAAEFPHGGISKSEELESRVQELCTESLVSALCDVTVGCGCPWAASWHLWQQEEVRDLEAKER